MPVLIGYSSRFGSMRECAIPIAETVGLQTVTPSKGPAVAKMLEAKLILRVQRTSDGFGCQKKLTNEIRIRAVSYHCIANHLHAVLNARRFVDVDVGCQCSRSGFAHERHLQVGVRVASLEAALNQFKSGQRFVQGFGRTLKERTAA